MAQSTYKNYQRGLLAFKDFRKQFGLADIWPIAISNICNFIAHSFEANLSQATIKCYLAGISFVCKLNDFPDPTQKFIVKKLVEGIGRSRVNISDARLPITDELLVSVIRVLPYVCNSTYETKLFRAAFSLAYHGLLRIGELAVSNGQIDHIIQISHDSFLQNLIKIKVLSSKTDQMGRGCEIIIKPHHNKEMCPVFLLNTYLCDRPQVSGPIFCHYDGRAITRYQFVSVLKKSLERAGINNKLYSSHSFRIGRATSLSMEGVPDHIIMQLGRWKSDAYKTYARHKFNCKICPFFTDLWNMEFLSDNNLYICIFKKSVLFT